MPKISGVSESELFHGGDIFTDGFEGFMILVDAGVGHGFESDEQRTATRLVGQFHQFRVVGYLDGGLANPDPSQGLHLTKKFFGKALIPGDVVVEKEQVFLFTGFDIGDDVGDCFVPLAGAEEARNRAEVAVIGAAARGFDGGYGKAA